MVFENRELRQVSAEWPMMSIPDSEPFSNLVDNVRAELDAYQSSGRYQYADPASIRGDGSMLIWFEFPEDATYFKLRHG